MVVLPAVALDAYVQREHMEGEPSGAVDDAHWTKLTASESTLPALRAYTNWSMRW